MILSSFATLFAVSFAAGIVNTIAGGGSFLTFPALMLTGLDARAANITSCIGLFPMQVGSGYAGRSLAHDTPHLSFKALCGISLVGGLIGAALLLLTPSHIFAKLVPWFVLFATALFAWGSFRKPGPVAREAKPKSGTLKAALAQFAISIYGGYYGAGIGFLMLAALTVAGMPIRKAGGTKNILAAVMNASAFMVFLFSKDIAWIEAGVVAAGSTLGSLAVGMHLLHKVNERYLRAGIIGVGAMLTIWLFLRA